MTRALSFKALHLAVAAAAAIFLAAPGAAADTAADAAARSTARKLGQEAVKLFESADYAAALEKFNTADSLVPAPTLGLYAARCLTKLGRLVEASERYLEVTRMQLDRNALPVMRKAQAEAVVEREKLLPTIPTLEVRVEGPKGEGVEVSVDNKVLLPGLIGEKRPINPGKHPVEARRADTTVTKEVNLAPGEVAQVTLMLPPLPAPPEARMPVMRKVGWAAIGLAGAGVVTGVAAGLIAIGKGQSLLGQCPNHMCPDVGTLSLAGSYDAARNASTAGFVLGAIGLAAGIPLLVVSPSVEYVWADGRPAPPPKKDGAPSPAPPKAPAARIEPWITLGGAGLRGAF